LENFSLVGLSQHHVRRLSLLTGIPCYGLYGTIIVAQEQVDSGRLVNVIYQYNTRHIARIKR
jgi:hypothetical protein